MPAPNILFFFTDQQRWDTCGCYGQPLPVTPNLDLMAAEGVRFANAFTCQPVCGPARACLQTGVYATGTGCFRNDIGLPPDRKTIAHHFGENGWRTGYIGKWHLASNYSAFSKGPPPPGTISYDHKITAVPVLYRGGWKDEWIASDVLEFTSHSYDGHLFDRGNRPKEIPPGRYRPDAMTDWALETIDRWADGDDPFFLFLSYIEPHHQNDHRHYEGPAGSRERFAGFVPPPDLEGEAGDWREEYPDYLGCVHALDANLGRIRAKLVEKGIAGDTIVVFASDHGSHFRTRNRDLSGDNFDDYKRTFHEGCSHIPLVIAGPGFRGGRVVEELVSLIDLPPTFLEAAGLAVPPTFHGRSLKPLATGEAVDWPGDVFMQISESQVGRALRTRLWSYSVHAPHRSGWKDPDSEVYVERFLYDLEHDPREKTNLVADPRFAGVRRELRHRLADRMVSAGEGRPLILPVGEEEGT